MRGVIGSFIRKNSNWQRTRKECAEHLWLKDTVAGEQTLLGFVYLWTGSNVKEENRRMINEQGEEHEIIIVGDMNAHIEDLDGYTDSTGNMLLDMCERHDLVLVNTSEKCEGLITWETGRSHSTIDYALMSHRMYNKLENMEIDEEGSRSLGSDHKRIKMSFTRVRNTVRGQDKEWDKNFYTEKHVKTAAKQTLPKM